MMSGALPATLARPPTRVSREVLEDALETACREFAPTLIVADEKINSANARVIPAGSLYAASSTVEGPDQSLGPQRPCYVQFSSGSTGRPKGIVLQWAGVQANLAAMGERIGARRKDHFVSWLPMYHDMGLFGSLLAPLYTGCTLTLMDPSTFIGNPLSWFRVLSEVRASMTAAPPSALHACLSLLRRRAPRDLDLSNLRCVICGSEPVSARLISEFREVLGRFGVHQDALKPVYGLAEATLAVTMPRAGDTPHVDRVAHSGLRAGKACPVAATEDGDALVAVGSPVEGIELEIRSACDQRLREREVGHIFLSGTCLMAGTIERGQFKVRHGDWLDTGDLGYLAGGELFVTGRSKDIIIKGGQNFAPERIEEMACAVEGVHRAAAFGLYSDQSQTERMVVIIEISDRRHTERGTRDRLKLRVRLCAREAGYPVDEVMVVPRGTLLRTTSGKIQRSECRSLYQRNQLLAGA
jgi:acyl-CoA synthetase (AMP-forming)/AMP-acid ligase II